MIRRVDPATGELIESAPAGAGALQRGRSPYPREAEMVIKGNRYLQVADRIAWLRRDYPCAVVRTSVHSVSATGAVIVAEVELVNDCGVVEGVGTGVGSCRVDAFADFIEKAETRAIGRALGACGYGTGDHAEGSHIADAPRRVGGGRHAG